MADLLDPRLIRIRTRPEILYVSQNRSVLATRNDGFINGEPGCGFFVDGTRLLSRYEYRLNRQPLTPNALSNVELHSSLGYYVAPAPPADSDSARGAGGAIAEQTFEVRLSRFISDGLHEDVDVTNFTQDAATLTLELRVDADFADVAETRGERLQHGTIRRRWETGRHESCLTFRYHARHAYSHQDNVGTAQIERGVALRFHRTTSPPARRGGTIRFQFLLEPRATWHLCVDIVPEIDGHVLPSQYQCYAFAPTTAEYDRRRVEFLSSSTTARTPSSSTLTDVAVTALDRAKRDLAALRLYDHGADGPGWTMAAGLPGYVSLFGRDTLTASVQASVLGPAMMAGTLSALARTQGADINDWRDEQPGRMLHQADNGPLARLGFNPLSRYYGSLTSSSFYPVVVSELWHWTGDMALVRPFIGPSLRAVRWLDEYARIDRGPFYQYETRSSQGLRNQGWKDSGDGMVREDGTRSELPIAPCEEQAFAYLTKVRLSEVLWWLDDKAEARRLHREAEELKARFNDAFWMPDLGFMAMGLEAHGRPIKSIGSNGGHCLAAGIVDERYVRRTADRLFEDDLFSGWGIRTLSDRHPAYNPYSYHRGSVWPVEHGSFALGFLRYGLHDHVERICRAQFEAAALFDFCRLPELFTGHHRDAAHPLPAHYPQANAPQAWSASAIWSMLQAMLGVYPYAPLHLLLVDPHLPEWLPEITLENLHVGDAVVALRFRRDRHGRSDFDVLDQRGRLHIVRQPSPWSLTATFGERLRDTLSSLLPHRSRRARV